MASPPARASGDKAGCPAVDSTSGPRCGAHGAQASLRLGNNEAALFHFLVVVVVDSEQLDPTRKWVKK